jgi:RND family efflux transporter MFP subunit
LRELKVKEGDAVQQGQVIGRIDESDVKDRLLQAKRQVDMAQAQLKTAQLAYDNNQALFNKNFISQTALVNSQAALSSAEANLQLAIAGERIAQKAVGDALLIAPFSGQVASVVTQMGERANVDARIVEIVDLSQMEVMVTLNPNEASAIQVGQTASLRVEGVSQDVSAKLKRINPSVDPATRSIRAYLQLTGSAGLRQGLFAQGQISVSEAKGLAVPLSAIRNDRPSPYVFKVLDGRIAMQAVELGDKGPLNQEQGGETWVLVRGLQAGDAILAATVGTVREGLKVTSRTKAQAPAANPAAGQGK